MNELIVIISMELTLVLLDVRTSDDSCFRVCVKLRDASASARVSNIGRASHVSHPTHPGNPQSTAATAATAAAAAAAGVDAEGALVVALLLLDVAAGTGTADAAGADDGVVLFSSLAKNDGGDRKLAASTGFCTLVAAGVPALVGNDVWRRGAFNMADSPPGCAVATTGAGSTTGDASLLVVVLLPAQGCPLDVDAAVEMEQFDVSVTGAEIDEEVQAVLIAVGSCAEEEEEEEGEEEEVSDEG